MFPKLKVIFSLLLIICISFLAFRSFYFFEVGLFLTLTLGTLVYYFKWHGLLYFISSILILLFAKFSIQNVPSRFPTIDVVIKALILTSLFMILFSIIDGRKIKKGGGKNQK